MKLQVNAKELKQAVAWVGKIAPKVGALGVRMPYQGIMLSVNGNGKLNVQAYNLSILATQQVPAEIEDSRGILVLDTKLFKKYLSKVAKKKDNTLLLDGDVWTFEDSKIKLEPICTSIEDIPDLSKVTPKEGKQVMIPDIGDLRLKDVARFMATDDSRPILASMLFRVLSNNATQSNAIELAAADGFRLITLGPTVEADSEVSGVVPRDAIALIASLKGETYMQMDGEYVRFVTKGQAVTAMLTDGRFPNLEEIIPKSEDGMWATFDTNELRQAIDTILTVTEADMVKLKLDYDHATIEPIENKGCQAMLSWEYGDEFIDFMGSYDGPFTIGFNGKYMVDCLALCGDEARIMFQGKNKPMRIDAGEAVMVLVPMHTR